MDLAMLALPLSTLALYVCSHETGTVTYKSLTVRSDRWNAETPQTTSNRVATLAAEL